MISIPGLKVVNGFLLTIKHAVLNWFKEHFDNLYNGEAEEEDTNDESFLNDDGREVAAPTWEEISAAISSPQKQQGPWSRQYTSRTAKEGR